MSYANSRTFFFIVMNKYDGENIFLHAPFLAPCVCFEPLKKSFRNTPPQTDEITAAKLHTGEIADGPRVNRNILKSRFRHAWVLNCNRYSEKRETKPRERERRKDREECAERRVSRAHGTMPKLNPVCVSAHRELRARTPGMSFQLQTP